MFFVVRKIKYPNNEKTSEDHKEVHLKTTQERKSWCKHVCS